MNSIQEDGSGNFTVAPINGLRAGTYAATVTVRSVATGISASFNVSFTVNDTAPTYGVTLDTTGTYVFQGTTVGYGARTARVITVTNTGNRPTGNLSLTLSGENSSSFVLSEQSMNTVQKGGSSNFTVAPKTGLQVGTYVATVTVSGENGISASFNVSFTVIEGGGSGGGTVNDSGGGGGCSVGFGPWMWLILGGMIIRRRRAG
jgi:uncharacterized membrane protein